MALDSFEPAPGPETTKSVFFDTVADTFAPSSSNLSFASPLENDSSVPVNTKVFPTRFVFLIVGRTDHLIPASLSRLIKSTFALLAKNLEIF